VINGLQMAAGGFGAWAASFPVNAALSVTDWRGIFFMLAALTVVVAAVIFIIVPERDLPTSAPPLGELIRDMARLFTRLAFWRVAPMATLSQATYLSIHSLWAGPWMRDMAGLERDAVAAVLSYLALAMMAGYTLIGVAAERISRRGVKLMDLAVGGMALFVVVVALLTVPGNHYPVPLWMVFGFLGTTGILTYAALTQIFPAAMAGRINAALNLLVLIAAFGFQWGIGAIINLWPATADGGYAPDGYKTAFLVLVGLQILALCWYLAAGMIQSKLRKRT
jgi:predicted MFS family arabinose efflux permease